MKKAGLLLLVLLFSLSFCSASIIINEVELNPLGDDNANEWMELYSDSPVELNNYALSSSNGRNMSFNASFLEYYTIWTNRNLLTNEKIFLSLKDNAGNILFSTINLSDSQNNNKTWQYCNGDWRFLEETKNYSNTCEDLDKNIDLSNTDAIINQNRTIITEGLNENKESIVIYSTQDNTDLANNSNINSDSSIIYLKQKNNSKLQNSIIYKSTNEYIKEYAPYAFGILCIFIIIILLIDKREKNKEYD
jgi:hypothetical protein